MFKRLLSFLIIYILLISIIPTASASAYSTEDSDSMHTSNTSTTLSATQVSLHIDGTGYNSFGFLTDSDYIHYYTSKGACTLSLQSDIDFYSLYIMFDLEPDSYTITNNTTGETITAGNNGFLHEYVTLPFSTTSVEITFPSEVSLSEIRAYTEGTPEDIQIWESPLDGETDILLLATHGDDDHLFFAGLLPLYAAERGYKVQVAYWTSHRPHTNKRTHEMLNGLWEVGVTNYPVFGPFEDFRQDTLDMTYWVYDYRGITEEELLSYVLTLVRRFDPQVVVCHDINGEYGHGMHMLYTDLLIKALRISNDATAYPEIAQQYGLWDVPKTYIHLYEENPITIDYDSPLDAFNGMTAFEVSQKIGFPCHVSQQKEVMFTEWLYGSNNTITNASQIKDYNPSLFGLYRSTVGEDTNKNDFMENIVSYEQQALLKEEQLRAEAERLENERNNTEPSETNQPNTELQAPLETGKSVSRQQIAILLVVSTSILVFILSTFLLARKRKRPK